MNKKGIEIAIGTLVLIIISLVVFTYSMYLLYSVFTQAPKDIARQSLDQIDRLMKQENAVIALPLANQQASEGEKLEFWVGIRNVKGTDSRYGVQVDFNSATTLDGKEMLPVDKEEIQSWLGTSIRSRLLPIKKREYASVPILLQVGTADSGIYVFNVCIFDENTPENINCQISNRNKFYNNELKQITVEII
ncbi:hypothetical protein HYV79_04380 [Candidatus Woesearchaeota archaeon]|nr:hypothetical protein [Candidatus Woesearchaeota archaeon]